MRVKIYQPTRTAMQSGRAKIHAWLIEPEMVTARVPEPLMGWVSAGDTMSELRDKLRFGSAEEAILFARKNGWEYYVEDPEERVVRPKSYLDNFKIVRPEDEERESSAK